MTMIIGHRGAAGYELENSMASFRKAAEIGVDCIEFDVRLTKDARPIVIHDRTLRRVANVRGSVARQIFEDFDKGIRLKNGERIMKLEEACKFISESGLKAYIEVKARDRRGVIIETVLDILELDRFYIGSFNHEYIREIDRNFPEIKTIAITNRHGKALHRLASETTYDCVSVKFNSIDKETVAIAHENGVEVFVWTIDEPDDIEFAKSLGVDGIVSNFPDRIR